MAISRSSFVVLGIFHPSSWTRALQVVPVMNAPIISASEMCGSSMHCQKKRRMYSCRDSSNFYRQLRRSHGFKGQGTRMFPGSSHEDVSEVGLKMDPSRWEVFQPGAGCIGEEEWKDADDEVIVISSPDS